MDLWLMAGTVLVGGGVLYAFLKLDERRIDRSLRKKYPAPDVNEPEASVAPVVRSYERSGPPATSNLTAYDWACLNEQLAEVHARVDDSIATVAACVVMAVGGYVAFSQERSFPWWITLPTAWAAAALLARSIRRPSQEKHRKAVQRREQME